MTTLLLGSTLGPNLRLDRILGEGAVGVVYRAHHLALGIDVAVKMLKRDGQDADPRYVQRFQREARTLARLDHPGIVRVLDVGIHEESHFLVMELVEGMSLDQYLKRRQGPVDEPTVLKILGAVAAALATAHRAGIIHRDLKPGNLLINRRGQLKVADLGLARDEHDDNGLTRERTVVGTPGYMAPEALQPGQPCDHRVDLYALGVIGYQLVFGRLPYTGTMSQIVNGHLSGRARFDLNTTCRPQTIAIVRRLMAHQTNDRYPDAELVVNEIRNLLHGGRGGRGANASGSSELFGLTKFIEKSLGASTSEKGGEHIVHTTARERLLVWVILAAVIAVAISAFVLWG
jgi:serine/threonine protein kinase